MAMGRDNEYAMPRHLVLDIEAASIPDAAEYLESASAPANYKDEEKIKSYVADANAAQLAKAALDPDLARIVALGLCDPCDRAVDVRLAHDEQQEALMLAALWNELRGRVTLVGYNILAYDLPVLMRRSLYLNVPSPAIQIDKYRHPTVIDLMSVLSFNGAQKYRSLSFYARRFGLPHNDAVKGSDIPGLVAAGDWAAVEAHVRDDVTTTVALGRRMGILQPVAESVGVR